MESHNSALKKQIAALMSLTLKSKTPAHLKAMVVDRLLWAATEDSDDYRRVKYVGQPYWSEKAIEHYRSLNPGRSVMRAKGLRHEHIVPRNYLKGVILRLKDKSTETIYNLLNKYAHSVVITKDDDGQLGQKGLTKTLPESFKVDDNFLARYREADITIMDVRGKCLKTHKFSEKDALPLVDPSSNDSESGCD